MLRPRHALSAAAFVTATALLSASPAAAAGFGIFEQGSKAMGMAGAFTAQADDPSAMFHNVGGLAFFDEREIQVGLTVISAGGPDFSGAPPFPGSGVREQGEDLLEIPPHFYWVQPMGEKTNFGLAINSPFGLSSEWDADRFSGRFISTDASLVTIDLNPNLGFEASPRFGIGFGLIGRFTTVELTRRQATINPFTGQPVDIATVDLESDFDSGIGWQAGFLNRVNDSLSWGFSYRSKIEVDYSGDGRFTQIATGNPALDAAVRASLPFDTNLPISTSLEFPDMASLGLAVALTANWLVETDVNWTGWSTVGQIVIDFGGALPNVPIRQDWDDANNYRLGLRWTRPGGGEWRFGYVHDETPQPDETTGPLLPDTNRNGITLGYGHRGNRVATDLALMYIQGDERTTLVNQDGFNGTYETDAVLFGVTFGW